MCMIHSSFAVVSKTFADKKVKFLQEASISGKEIDHKQLIDRIFDN